MAGQVLGKFDGYTLRAIEESDYSELEQWIEADQVHRGILDPEFFMGQAIDRSGNLAPDPNVTVFAIADRSETLMYIRLATATRVHIQFPPAPAVTDGSGESHQALHRYRTRIRNALIKGMAFIEAGLMRTGVREWIFETESPTLRQLVQKSMGFMASPNEMVRLIIRGDGPDSPQKPLHPAPHTNGEAA